MPKKSKKKPEARSEGHREEPHRSSDPRADSRTGPADSASNGSIVQHLDMAEKGPFRGDEILHHHGIPERHEERPELDGQLMEQNFQVDMSERDREGDEESGDEHSSGLQGSDQQELQYDTESPEDSDSGLPGEMTEKLAHRPALANKSKRAS